MKDLGSFLNVAKQAIKSFVKLLIKQKPMKLPEAFEWNKKYLVKLSGNFGIFFKKFVTKLCEILGKIHEVKLFRSI